MLSIRQATPDDAETLQDLILELAAYERLMDEAEPSVHLLREHLSEEALTGCEALIAETERGTAVGFALFFHNYSTFLTNAGLYVEDLFVKSTYRGEGIGFALLQRCAEIAEARGCRRMEWAVLDLNSRFSLPCQFSSRCPSSACRLEISDLAKLGEPTRAEHCRSVVVPTRKWIQRHGTLTDR